MSNINEVLFSPLFFVFITLLAAVIGKIIEDRLKNPVFNRFLIALILILLFIVFTGIKYEQYKTGGDMLSIFLGPATVALAIPLYEQLSVLIKNKFVVLIGILVGCAFSFVSIFISSKIFMFSQEIYLSTLSKSVTTPVAIMLSEKIGGVSALTMFSVVIAGIVGATVLPSLAKLLKIRNKVAIGLGIGTASHVLGTAKAMELGDVEGAFSSLAVSVAGIMTVIIVPLFLNFIKF